MQKVSLCFKLIEQYIYQHRFYLLNYIPFLYPSMFNSFSLFQTLDHVLKD